MFAYAQAQASRSASSSLTAWEEIREDIPLMYLSDLEKLFQANAKQAAELKQEILGQPNTRARVDRAKEIRDKYILGDLEKILVQNNVKVPQKWMHKVRKLNRHLTLFEDAQEAAHVILGAEDPKQAIQDLLEQHGIEKAKIDKLPLKRMRRRNRFVDDEAGEVKEGSRSSVTGSSASDMTGTSTKKFLDEASVENPDALQMMVQKGKKPVALVPESALHIQFLKKESKGAQLVRKREVLQKILPLLALFELRRSKTYSKQKKQELRTFMQKLNNLIENNFQKLHRYRLEYLRVLVDSLEKAGLSEADELHALYKGAKLIFTQPEAVLKAHFKTA